VLNASLFRLVINKKRIFADGDSSFHEIIQVHPLTKRLEPDPYMIEEMESRHEHLLSMTKLVRQDHQDIRTKFNQMVNSIAYRIHISLDAANIDYPDAEIERMLTTYSRHWPYDTLTISDLRKEETQKHDFQSSAQILKNLDSYEQSYSS